MVHLRFPLVPVLVQLCVPVVLVLVHAHVLHLPVVVHLFVPFVLVLVHARVPLSPGCGTSLCSVCPVWQPSAYSSVEFHLRRLFYISCAPVVPVVVHLCAPLVRHGSILLSPRVLLVRLYCLCFTFWLYKDYRFWCFTCFVIIYFIGWVTYACSPLWPFNSLYFHSLICSFCQLRFRLPPHLSALPFLSSNIMSIIIPTAFLSHPGALVAEIRSH